MLDTEDPQSARVPPVGGRLGQEIRLYHEFGHGFEPAVVVLPYCGNDPEDDLLNSTTSLDQGRFTFRPVAGSGGPVKSLTWSWLQFSQLYNLLRQPVWRHLRGRSLADEIQDAPAASSGGEGPTRSYAELLDAFARDLAAHHIGLVLLEIPGHLERFPLIVAKARGLESEGVPTRFDPAPCPLGLRDPASPEGHDWGIEAHARVGTALAPIVPTKLRPREG